MSTLILYSAAIILLLISLSKDRTKTTSALKKAWRAFENILPQMLVVIFLVGILLAAMNAEQISLLLGSGSGWSGVVIAAVIGVVTLIPGFVAFPTAAMLLEGGAGYMQIGAFISALMMVGVVTMPVEIKYFGTRTAVLRNVFAFAFSFLVALVIGTVVGQA